MRDPIRILPWQTSITVLVDSCETADEIDEARARAARDRAEEELRQKQSLGEYKMTQAALARALSRLAFSSGKKHGSSVPPLPKSQYL